MNKLYTHGELGVRDEASERVRRMAGTHDEKLAAAIDLLIMRLQCLKRKTQYLPRERTRDISGLLYLLSFSIWSHFTAEGVVMNEPVGQPKLSLWQRMTRVGIKAS